MSRGKIVVYSESDNKIIDNIYFKNDDDLLSKLKENNLINNDENDVKLFKQGLNTDNSFDVIETGDNEEEVDNSYIDAFVKENKNLIGKNVSLDFDNKEAFYKITGLKSGTNIFEKDEYRVLVISIIENNNDYLIDEKDLIDFLKGENISCGIRNDEKGGSIMLINEEIKNEFNDIDLFIQKYKDYLIGKKITYGNGETQKINRLRKDVNKDKSYFLLINETGIVLQNELYTFVNGGEVNLGFSLILSPEINNKEEIIETIEEEIIEDKINKPEYKYYIKDTKLNKINLGFEYKEDAEEEINKLTKYGNDNLVLLTKKFININGPDPELNENWSIDDIDFNIIKLAFLNGEVEEEKINYFLDEFKQGKQKSVIKARLIYFLEYSQKKLRTAFVMSELENCNLYIDYCTRVEMQLLKSLKNEL